MIFRNEPALRVKLTHHPSIGTAGTALPPFVPLAIAPEGCPGDEFAVDSLLLADRYAASKTGLSEVIHTPFVSQTA